MTSKLNEGDSYPQNVDSILDNSNSNRYARSYKSKTMDRHLMEKKQRAKGRIVRPDDVPMSSISGPIKIREKVRLMSDTLATEEPTKTTLKVKDKLKNSDVSKDDAIILAASPKGREKAKQIAEPLKDEAIMVAPLKQREKVKISDNVKEDNISGNSRGRDKSKQGIEGFKGDQSPLIGLSPIKLREKSKQADIMKEEVLSSASSVYKGQEKSKTNIDDLSSAAINSSAKVREKMKIIEMKEDDGACLGSLSSKETEKMKTSSLLFKEESTHRVSPLKLREKVKISEMSKDDPMTGSTTSLKVKDKIKASKDSSKEVQCYSSHAALMKFKEKERGKVTEKLDDVHSLPILPTVKIRDKSKMIIDTDDTVRSGGMSVKKDKVKLVDEIKNIDDAKKDLNLSIFDVRESLENENTGSSLMTRRESKTGASSKSRKMRSMISSGNSSKKPMSELKITLSRHEVKDELFVSQKEDSNINLKYGDLGSLSRTDGEEIMNSDVSSSQDQRGSHKFSASLKGQNRLLSRVFTLEEREWHPGDLAWGRIGQHPFWPCMVCSDGDSGQFKKMIKVGRVSSQILHVQFFGDKGRHSWLPVKNILQYEGREKLRVLSEGILSQTKRKNRKFISSFRVKPSSKTRWETAVKEADNAISLSREQRKTYFEDLLLNSTSLRKPNKLKENNEAHVMGKKKRKHSVSYKKESKKLKANHTDSESNLSKTPTRKKQGRNKK